MTRAVPVLLAAALIAGLSTLLVSRPARPTIVLVTIDTLRADRLAAWGGQGGTPALDGLAEGAVRYTKTYSPCPLTVPAHASLLTGRTPASTGVHDNHVERLGRDVPTIASVLAADGYHTAAVVGAFVTSRQWGFDHGFATFDDDLGTTTDRRVWTTERTADRVVDRATSILADADGPTFLWVHVYDAHDPYRPPAPWPATYDGEVGFVDSQMARLLEAVPKDAYVVVASDHGEGLGDGEPRHGVLLGDATVHVPLLVSGPGLVPRDDDRVASLVDVAPTILGLAGLPCEGCEGRDLDPRGDAAPVDRAVTSETWYGWRHYGWAPLFRQTSATGDVQATSASGAPPELAAYIGRSVEGEAGALDPADRARLEALGYETATVAGPHDVDPRVGVSQLVDLDRISMLPPAAREAALEVFVAAHPDAPEARQRLAKLWEGQPDRFDDYVSAMTVVAAQTDDPRPLVGVGYGCLRRGLADEAERWFEDAAAADPELPDPQEGLALALVEEGRAEEAAVVAEAGLARWPDDGRLLEALARADAKALVREGRLPALIAAARQDPPWPDLLAQAAAVSWIAGDADGAAALATDALELDPQDAVALKTLEAAERELDDPARR